MSRAPRFAATGERASRAASWAARLAEDGESPEWRQEFQAWLDADCLNGAALEEIIGAWHAVERYATSEPMMVVREAALASARRARRRRQTAPSRGGLARVLVAATLLLVVGGGVWAWLTPRTYKTEVGERRVVALSDGSKISLDAATIVRVRYTPENRRLWLERGRAKFEVAKNPLRPFSVSAADKVVVATGTAFSVELVQKQVRVVLYEGHVALLERAQHEPPRTVTIGARRLPLDRLLTPGRELILPEKSLPQLAPKAAIVTLADPVATLSWEAGLLEFEDERLSVVVDRMNRYAERPLAIGNAGAANLRISGVFRAGDTDALVQGLATAFGVRARVGPGATLLFKDDPPAPAA